MRRRLAPPVGRSATALTGALLAIALVGCTAPADSSPRDPVAVPTAPEVNAPSEQLSGETLTGTGPTPEFPGVPFPVASGARSVVIDFACDGGHAFTVELGDATQQQQAPLDGICDGVSELALPVTDRTGSTLSVRIPDDVEWSAAPRFSAAAFPTDPAIQAECERFSGPISALLNADTGYGPVYAAFDEAEWSVRVDRAVVELAAMADASTTALAEPLGQLAAIAGSPDRVAGQLLTLTEPITRTISGICAVNQTPVFLLAEFGG